MFATQRYKSDLTISIDHLEPIYKASDLAELRSYSMTLMSDPIVDITLPETRHFQVPIPVDERERTALQEVIHKAYGQHLEYRKSAFRIGRLCVERLENNGLCRVLKIDDSFNYRAYFFTLHMWLAHTRLLHEGWKGETIDDELFEEAAKLFAEWLVIKKVEEHRFARELQNVQEFMYTFCIHLDLAMKDKDTMPARIRQVLWAHLYNSELDPDDETLDLTTKYVLRQLLHILQLDTAHFMTGNFVWADLPVPGVGRTRIIPAFQQPMKLMGFPNGRTKGEFQTGIRPRIVGQEERKAVIEQRQKEAEEKKLEERRRTQRPRLITMEGDFVESGAAKMARITSGDATLNETQKQEVKIENNDKNTPQNNNS